MRVLIGTGTTDVSTEAVARRVATVLREHGHMARVTALALGLDLSPYDVVVLGSRVRRGDWSPWAATFVHANVSMLQHRPLWTFSVAAVGDRDGELGRIGDAVLRVLRRDPLTLSALERSVPVLDHVTFSAQPEDRTGAGRCVARAVARPAGWPRDACVDEWARSIARRLSFDRRRVVAAVGSW